MKTSGSTRPIVRLSPKKAEFSGIKAAPDEGSAEGGGVLCEPENPRNRSSCLLARLSDPGKGLLSDRKEKHGLSKPIPAV